MGAFDMNSSQNLLRLEISITESWPQTVVSYKTYSNQI